MNEADQLAPPLFSLRSSQLKEYLNVSGSIVESFNLNFELYHCTYRQGGWWKVPTGGAQESHDTGGGCDGGGAEQESEIRGQSPHTVRLSLFMKCGL